MDVERSIGGKLDQDCSVGEGFLDVAQRRHARSRTVFGTPGADGLLELLYLGTQLRGGFLLRGGADAAQDQRRETSLRARQTPEDILIGRIESAAKVRQVVGHRVERSSLALDDVVEGEGGSGRRFARAAEMKRERDVRLVGNPVEV